MNNLAFLFRNSYETEEEFQVLKQLAPDSTFELRTKIPPNSTVIGRFSVLPFYTELERDLASNGSKLINSFDQHRYVADIRSWYGDLHYITPKTWFSMQEYIADSYEGPVVLKGETNSKRELWLTHMFAKDKNDARKVYFNLMDDSLIKAQNVCIRVYEPLKEYTKCLSGMPVVDEYRYFVLNGRIVASGFYWSSFMDDISIDKSDRGLHLVKKAISLIGDNCNFYTIDVAQKANGEWIVIELNDGCMSGTNSIDPKDLYKAILNA